MNKQLNIIIQWNMNYLEITEYSKSLIKKEPVKIKNLTMKIGDKFNKFGTKKRNSIESKEGKFFIYVGYIGSKERKIVLFDSNFPEEGQLELFQDQKKYNYCFDLIEDSTFLVQSSRNSFYDIEAYGHRVKENEPKHLASSLKYSL